MSHSPANASFVRCVQEASTKRLWQYATALPDGSEALRVEVCRRNDEVLEIVGTLQWAMPLVASVGIAVTVWLTMHGWRKEDQRREVERAKADARRDALLEQNAMEIRSLRGEIKAVEGRLEGRMDALESRLEGRMDGLEGRINAHEDKCEARWLQQAKEFGEMRGALAALQRTVEAGGAKGVADPPQDAGQR